MQDASSKDEIAGSGELCRMQAVVMDEYGPPQSVRVTTVARPDVGDSDILLRVRAASVCRGDVYLLAGKPYLIRLAGYGFLRPKHRIPGQSLAGDVVAVGKAVSDIRPGDRVFGEIPFGAFAEYVSAEARLLAPMPENLSYEEAAAAPLSAVTALQGLRDVGGLQKGQSVLINGASGGVGTYAVQIAKALGGDVTAVCSARHVALVRALGADRVIDYAEDDFTRSGIAHDVILDLVSNRGLGACRLVMKRDGVFVAGASRGNWIGPVIWLIRLALANAVSTQRYTVLVARPDRDDLLVLKRMMEEGLVKPVIERRFPLRQAALALDHVAQGRSQGVTVLAVAP